MDKKLIEQIIKNANEDYNHFEDGIRNKSKNLKVIELTEKEARELRSLLEDHFEFKKEKDKEDKYLERVFRKVDDFIGDLD